MEHAPSSRMGAMARSARTYFAYATPFGRITIAANGHAITQIVLGSQTLNGEARATELTNLCANELQEYFAGKRTVFDIPIDPAGSEFQMQVWEAASKIPYGQTMTYQDVAKMMGRPTAYRSVGAAIKANPIIVLIPAHRVIPASGTLETDDRAPLRAAFRALEANG